MFGGRKPRGDAGADASSTPAVKNKGLPGNLFGTSRSGTVPSQTKPPPTTPTKPELADDDLAGMFKRAITLLENITRRVSAGRVPDDIAATDDDSRQFTRLNEVKRLATRIRTGVGKLPDASERVAWEAQLGFLDTETASAVDAVLRAASPAPKANGWSSRVAISTTPVGKKTETPNATGAGDMFAGLTMTPNSAAPVTGGPMTGGPMSMPPTPTGNQVSMNAVLVSPASANPPSAVNASAGGLFSGLSVSPSPSGATTLNSLELLDRQESLNAHTNVDNAAPPETSACASPGISLEPPPPPLDVRVLDVGTTVVTNEARKVEETHKHASNETENGETSPLPTRRPRVRLGYARETDEGVSGAAGPSAGPSEAEAESTAKAKAQAETEAKARGDEEAGEKSKAEASEAARVDAAARADAEAEADALRLRAQATAAEQTALSEKNRQEAHVLMRWQAAVRIQSHHRGRRDRMAVSKMQAAVALALAAVAKADLERSLSESKAASRIQAALRARVAKAEVAKINANAKAASLAAVAAVAEIRAAEAEESAAAAEKQAALAEAQERRAQERAALKIQTLLRGRTARLQVSKRRVAAAAARDAGRHAEDEEKRARDAGARIIQSRVRARNARETSLLKNRAATIAADTRRESAGATIANQRGVRRATTKTANATAGLATRDTEKGEDGWAPKSVGGGERDGIDTATDSSSIDVNDEALATACATARTAMRNCLETFRGDLTSEGAISGLAACLETASATALAAAIEARRVSGKTPAAPPAAPSFDLMSF